MAAARREPQLDGKETVLVISRAVKSQREHRPARTFLRLPGGGFPLSVARLSFAMPRSVQICKANAMVTCGVSWPAGKLFRVLGGGGDEGFTFLNFPS